VIVVVAPRQIFTADGVTTGVGGVAFTTVVAVAVQPVAVIAPVTVYVVFRVGLAVTEAPVVELNPEAGLQV